MEFDNISCLLFFSVAVLKADGHEVILEEIPDWNDVQLIVNGEMVFQCNINDLDFGKQGPILIHPNTIYDLFGCVFFKKKHKPNF